MHCWRKYGSTLLMRFVSTEMVRNSIFSQAFRVKYMKYRSALLINVHEFVVPIDRWSIILLYDTYSWHFVHINLMGRRLCKTTSYWHHSRPFDFRSTLMMSIWCRFDVNCCNLKHDPGTNTNNYVVLWKDAVQYTDFFYKKPLYKKPVLNFFQSYETELSCSKRIRKCRAIFLKKINKSV